MWKRKRDKVKVTAGSAKDATAKAVADFILLVQAKVVGLLQRLERRCSLTQRKLIFYLFCITATVYCCYILVDAVLGNKAEDSPVFESKQVIKPNQQPRLLPKDSTKYRKHNRN